MYFASEDPLGRRIKLVPEPPTGPESPAWMTIVGVSPTVRQRNLREPDPDPVVYVPYRFAPAHVLSQRGDRKSTRLNSSHLVISYAVFCLKKKKKHCIT